MAFDDTIRHPASAREAVLLYLGSLDPGEVVKSVHLCELLCMMHNTKHATTYEAIRRLIRADIVWVREGLYWDLPMGMRKHIRLMTEEERCDARRGN